MITVLIFVGSMAAVVAAAPFLLGLLIWIGRWLMFKPLTFQDAMNKSVDIAYPVHLL